MGNDIKTGSTTGSNYRADYVGEKQKSKQTALNNRPEPMSLPINDLS